MGILDRKTNTFDDPAGAAVPPAPPGPPPSAKNLMQIPPMAQPRTDAGVVANAIDSLEKRTAEIAKKLNDRLAPICVSDGMGPISDTQPAQKLAAPYFDGLYVNLHAVVSHLDEIESIMDRLAI